MKKKIIYLTIGILISGCTSISKVTDDSSFTGFTKSEIILKKQVLVCRDVPLEKENGSSIDYQLIYNVNLIEKCPIGETIGLLPEGSEIRIEEVEKHQIYSAKSVTKIYFLGNSKLPNGKSFEFYYLYGHEGFYEHQPW